MSDTDTANLLGKYANLVDRWVFRWKRAATEARNRTYTTERLTADVVASYADALEWWSAPMRLFTTELPPPLVTIEVSAAAAAAARSVDIADPGEGTPTLKAFTAEQMGTDVIRPRNATVSLSTDRRTLTVSLADLDQLSPRMKKGDRHNAEVLFGPADDLIAKVLVIVKD